MNLTILLLEDVHASATSILQTIRGVVLNNSDDTFSINVTARDAFAEERITNLGELSSCTNRSNLDNSDGTAHASCG